MPRKELLVVTYDISNDKRRTKLHNKLLDYGTPVQYSVFECHLDQKMKSKLDIMIKKTIRPRKDSLRIYTLCARCEKQIIAVDPGSKSEKGVGDIILS